MRYVSKTTILTLFVILGVVGGGSFAAAQWQAKWHGTDFIRSGTIIPAQQMGENLEFLYKQVQSWENCTFTRLENQTCTFTYNCNCGKYGCSTCTQQSTRTDLQIECPGQETLIFEGACKDLRQTQTCGKYGCS